MGGAEVRQGVLLSFGEIGEQSGGGTEGLVDGIKAESFERSDLELAQEEVGGAVWGEVEGGAVGDREGERVADAPLEGVSAGAVGLGKEKFGCANAAQFVDEAGVVGELDVKVAAGEFDAGKTESGSGVAECGEDVGGACVEEGVVGERTRGDDADDGAFDDALGEACVLHLFADGDLESGGDETAEVGFEGVVWDAGHGRAAVAGGEGDAKDFGGDAGVVVEKFVEVAHAEEEECVADVSFLVGVLAHGGGEFVVGPGGGSGRGGGVGEAEVHGEQFIRRRKGRKRACASAEGSGEDSAGLGGVGRGEEAQVGDATIAEGGGGVAVKVDAGVGDEAGDFGGETGVVVGNDAEDGHGGFGEAGVDRGAGLLRSRDRRDEKDAGGERGSPHEEEFGASGGAGSGRGGEANVGSSDDNFKVGAGFSEGFEFAVYFAGRVLNGGDPDIGGLDGVGHGAGGVYPRRSGPGSGVIGILQ